MYAMTGLGASASVSLTSGGKAKSSESGSECLSQPAHDAAITDCKRLGMLAPAGMQACVRASSPVCALRMATPIADPEQPAHPSVLWRLPASPPASATPAPGHSLLASSPLARKLPVPAAAPVPIVGHPPAPEEAGVPTWLWIVGGVAVLGTAAVIYKRKKAA